MNHADYMDHDGVGLALAVARGETTAGELAEIAIALTDRMNPALNAVIARDDAGARMAALAPTTGPLAGVPFLLKDVYLESDRMPTTYGSAYLKGTAPRPDSTLVRRWRAAGLSIFGKTNAPEFAADFVTEPLAYGATLNPWDRRLTVGGSSGGAGSAVAAGLVPLAHATDLGGSIRIPASCCGVYGFKPTSGLNTVGPYFAEIANGLNSDHVLTRSVRDSAASLDVTAKGSAGYLAALDAPLPKLRVLATVQAAGGTIAGPRQVAAVEKTIAMLLDLGHEVTYLDASPLQPVGEWFDLLWITDIPPLLTAREAELGRKPREDELEPLTWLSLKALEEAGPEGIAQALQARAETRAANLALFDDYDILLTPGLAKDCPRVGDLGFRDHATVKGWAEAGYGATPFFILANVAGQPAALLPLPMEGADLPVGVQIMAKPDRDLLVLQLSRQLEPLFDWASSHRALHRRLAAEFSLG